jgi:RND family efflux transporter MFP subunit
MKKQYIFLLAPAVALLSACGGKDKQQAAATAAALNAPTPVNVTEAKIGEAVYYDSYEGSVTALNTVELRAEVSGFITNIYFEEGEVVQKGKPLYEIDRRKYQAAYDQTVANLASAQANLVRAQKDVDRYNMLLKNDAVARQTVDQASATYETSKSQVAVAKAAIESAKTDLSYSIITAPFTGRIGISQVRLGAQVTPGSTLLNTISSENPIAVNIVVDQRDINRFYALQTHATDSTFKLQLPDGTIYKRSGRILTIDRGVNNQTGTVIVRIQYPNDKDALKDGMSVVTKVLNEQSGRRILIPYKAVTEQMGEFFVFVSQDTIAKQHKVKLGQRVGSDIMVMSGIESGDKIITEGFQRLRDGGKITLGAPGASGSTGSTGASGASGK